MIKLIIIYLLGVIVAVIWTYYDVTHKYLVLTLRDTYMLTISCLLSWFTVIRNAIAWINDNWDRVVWEKK